MVAVCLGGASDFADGMPEAQADDIAEEFGCDVLEAERRSLWHPGSGSTGVGGRRTRQAVMLT